LKHIPTTNDLNFPIPSSSHQIVTITTTTIITMSTNFSDKKYKQKLRFAEMAEQCYTG